MGIRGQLYFTLPNGEVVRESGTFETKRDRDRWKLNRIQELEQLGRDYQKGSLRFVLERYTKEVSPTKRGGEWEKLRISAWVRAGELPITLPISKITREHIARWRDARSAKVSDGTVIREMGLLSNVFEVARREWRMIQESPMSGLKKPKTPEHRNRLITQSEQRLMLRQLGVILWRCPRTIRESVGFAMLFALHTGMRSSEITNLRWTEVHPKYVRILKTKTDTPRDVPLDRSARRIIETMRGFDAELVFAVKAETRDAIYRRARDQAGLAGFTFHDTRHNAATRIGAKVGRPGKLSFPQFCAVFGWQDPRHALIYCNPRASELADLL